MRLLITLGREKELALAELHALCEKYKKTITRIWVEKHIACIEIEVSVDWIEKLNSLAGSVKIAECIGDFHSQEKMLEKTVAFLSARHNKKLIFGISDYSGKLVAADFGKKIKQLLCTTKTHIRFIAKDEPLNAAAVRKNGLLDKGIELIMSYHDNRFFLGKTLQVQDVDFWSEFDYGRPSRDARRGMLPPKLAALLLNLAQIPDGGTVLDPFCGIGTIPLMASLRGYSAIAADADPDAIQATKQNTTWLYKKFPAAQPITILQCDARVVHTRIKTPVDAIVTETFLGNPKNLTYNERILEVKKLTEMYSIALKNWRALIKPTGAILIILPLFETKKGTLSLPLQKVIAQYGYTITNKFKYARAGQRVRREILLLHH